MRHRAPSYGKALDAQRGRSKPTRSSSAGIRWIDPTSGADVISATVYASFINTDADDGEEIYLGAGPGWHNIVDSGAIEGSDATTVIQTLNDALCAAGGGTIYVPKGTFLLSSETSGQRYGISLCSNITLLGEDPFLSILEYDPDQTLPAGSVWIPIEIGTATTGVEHVTIRGIGLLANWTALNNGGTEIVEGIAARHNTTVTAHSDDILIEHVNVIDANGGIYCAKNGSTDPGSTANRFQRWTVRNCLVDTTNNKAIELQMAQDSAIIGNTTKAATDGIQLLHSAERIRVIGNSVEYKNGGINVREACSDVVVMGNVVGCIGGGSASLSDFPAGLVLGTEDVADSPNLDLISIIGNQFIDGASSLKVGMMFGSFAGNVAATYTNIKIHGNTFNGGGPVYLTDATAPTKSSASGLEFFDNYVSGDLITDDAWSSAGTRVSRNHIVGDFTLDSDDWDLRGANVVDGTFSDTATGTIYDGSGGATALDDLTDVSAAAPIEGNALRFDGTNWISVDGFVVIQAPTPTVTPGPPFSVAISSKWGIDGSGDPYYDTVAVTAGEEAALVWDPINDQYALVSCVP